MDLMLNLPVKVSAEILLTYLTIADIGQLDIAVTNYTLRHSLYAVYSALPLHHSKQGVSPAQIMWFFDRSIRFDNLIFTRDLISIDLSEIFNILIIRNIRAAMIKKIDFSATSHCAKTAHYSKMLSCCTGLESVSFSKCKDVTKNMLTNLGHKCANLRCLDVSHTAVTNSALISLAENCSTLTHLNLSACRNITDRGVIFIAKYNSMLSELYLRDNQGISSSGVIAIAKRCKVLTVLYLSFCRNVSDTPIIVVGDNCPLLTRVGLKGCDSVTNAGKSALLQKCKYILSLDI